MTGELNHEEVMAQLEEAAKEIKAYDWASYFRERMRQSVMPLEYTRELPKVPGWYWMTFPVSGKDAISNESPVPFSQADIGRITPERRERALTSDHVVLYAGPIQMPSRVSCDKITGTIPRP